MEKTFRELIELGKKKEDQILEDLDAVKAMGEVIIMGAVEQTARLHRKLYKDGSAQSLRVSLPLVMQSIVLGLVKGIQSEDIREQVLGGVEEQMQEAAKEIRTGNIDESAEKMEVRA